LILSDEQMADLKRQLDEEQSRPEHWWLSEEEREKEIQTDKEYEEYEEKIQKAGKAHFEGRLVSKKEIIDWLSHIDESARFYVSLSFQEKFPPRNRPSPPPLNCDDIGQKNFRVLSPDSHGFDRDKDGIGCDE